MSVRERRMVAGAALLGGFCFLYRYLSFRGFANDHYLHLARAQQMLLGELPIRDFLDPGFLLMSALSATAQALFGRMLLPEAILVFGCLSLAAALTFWIILRMTGSFMLAAVLSLLQILILPTNTSYPKIVVYPIAVIAIGHYVRLPGTARAAILAIVTGLSFLMRYDHGIYVAAGCAAAIVAVHWKDGLVPVSRSIAAYALATTVMLTPYVLYIQWAAGLTPYFSDAVAFTQAEFRNYPLMIPPTFALEPRSAFTLERREATVHVRWVAGVTAVEREALENAFGLTSDQPLDGRTQRYRIQDLSRLAIERIVRHPRVEDTAGVDRTSFTVETDRLADACVVCVASGSGLHLAQNADAWLYYVGWAAVAAGGVLVAFTRSSSPVLAAVTVMTALAALTLVRSPVALRISEIWGLLPLLLGSVLAVPTLAGRWRPLLLRMASALVLAVTAGAVLIAGETREEFSWTGLPAGPAAMASRFRQVTQELKRPQDALQRGSREETVARTIAAYVAVCTRPSDRLFVLGFAPEFFWNTQRGFAAGYPMFQRGAHTSDDVQRRGIERWRAQSVPLAIVFEGEYADMAEQFPLIASELRRRYSPVYREETERRGRAIMVFAERGLAVERTYEPLGTPCFNG